MTFFFLHTFAILASSSLGFPRYDEDLFDSRPELRIVGGQEVEPYSIPYQVALFEKETNFEDYGCGGSLIAPQWVLTAAHCVDDKSITFKTMMGVHNISNTETTAWTAQVKETFIHENYNPWNISNDIALLKLDHPAPINYSPISPVLRSVEARILWGPICRFLFWIKRHDTKFNYDIHLCTLGWGKKGGCFGDSGGPLTIKESDGQRTLVGVNNFINDSNCEKTGLTAYARVTKYLDWIHNVTDIPLRP